MILPHRAAAKTLLLALLGGILLGGRVRAEGEERGVVVVTAIEGPLAEAMAATLSRAVRRADAARAEALVVEFDTPGGSVELMERLARILDRAETEPIALVRGEAVSAGAYLALACERIFTFPHAQIGSSYPIVLPGLAPSPEGGDPAVQEKLLSYLRAKFRDRAQNHDRPGLPALAEAMVDPSIEVLLVRTGGREVCMTRDEFEDLRRTPAGENARIVRTVSPKGRLLALTAQEAFELGVSDGIVASREELLRALALDDAEVVEIRPTWSEELAGQLERFQWILLVLGLVLLYVELKVPGFGLPGALGLLCLGLVLMRNWLVGLAETPEILLIAAGFALLLVEIFLIPGFGVAGIAGLTCVALGILFSFLPFFVPEGPIETGYLAATVRSFGLALAASLVVLFALGRFLPDVPWVGRLVLRAQRPETTAGTAVPEPRSGVPVGAKGRALTPLRPAGKVKVEGRVLDAVTEGEWVEAGERIEVVRSETYRLVVRPLGPADTSGGS